MRRRNAGLLLVMLLGFAPGAWAQAVAVAQLSGFVCTPSPDAAVFFRDGYVVIARSDGGYLSGFRKGAEEEQAKACTPNTRLEHGSCLEYKL